MGFPPPPAAPSVPDQGALSASASFSSGLPVASLCGFTIPSFTFSIGLHLPALTFPPPLPIFGLSFGLNCSLDNPLSVSANLPYGGGRIGTGDPDPDLEFDQ